MQSNCTFPGHFAPLTYYDHEYVTTSCVPPKHTVSIINVGFQILKQHEFEDSFQKVIKLLDSARLLNTVRTGAPYIVRWFGLTFTLIGSSTLALNAILFFL